MSVPSLPIGPIETFLVDIGGYAHWAFNVPNRGLYAAGFGSRERALGAAVETLVRRARAKAWGVL